MNRKKTVQMLVQNLCIDGVLPSEDIQKRVASCRSCFDALALVAELVEPESSQTWYESFAANYLCDEVEAELDLLAAKDPEVLAAESPLIARHIQECALCAERYVSARRLLEAESEGVLGQEIRLSKDESLLWVQVKEKFFELTQDVVAKLRSDFSGFQPVIPDAMAGLMLDSAHSFRSQQPHVNATQEMTLELSPPTISDRLILRLLCEADGLVTFEFICEHELSERLVMILFEVRDKPSLIEARSLSGSQSVVRFEHLAIKDYFVEVRGVSGVSRIPLNIRIEEE